MTLEKPYIGCKIGLISRAQNRYEGILYTIDKVNSTVVLAKVRCFGTEGRPTDRPTPPKDDVYDYITFRGSDIKDIALCEFPRSHHGLPPDPAIIQSSRAGPSSICSALGPFSPVRLPDYNQLATGSLLNQQYAAALGFGPVHPGMLIRKGPMVEKAVQTQHVEGYVQRRGLTASQGPERLWERRWSQRTRGEDPRPSMGTGARATLCQVVPNVQDEAWQQNKENRPLVRGRPGFRRRRNHGRRQLMGAAIPSPSLKFDTDFDFDSSNAQFIKDQQEWEGQNKMNGQGGNQEVVDKEGEELHLTAQDDHSGPKCYYDKAKSFFDNISSDIKFRLTRAEERKRNLETFGVPGRFLRGRVFRGGYAGASASSYGSRRGRL